MGVENNISFGSGILYIDDILVSNAVDDMEVSDTSVSSVDESFSTIAAHAAEFECEIEAVSSLFSELAGQDSESTFQLEYDCTRYEQVRKHKKKRINKKWAKRYGYREVPCHAILKNARFTHDQDGMFVIMSDCPSIKRKRG